MTHSFDGLGLIQDIDVRLTVELGRKQLRLRDILALGEGSVVELDRLTDEPLDILVNGKLIARGEVVSEGNRFAIRVLEIVGMSGGPAPTVSAPPPATAAVPGANEPAADRRAPPPIVERA